MISLGSGSARATPLARNAAWVCWRTLPKPFSLMAAPNRTHGISEGENTTRHLYETLARFLTNHTRPGPLPR
jgi:hypothetical protein